MKKFLLKVSLFSCLLLGGFYYVFQKADGYTDPYYVRFTTKKQSSLILGNSKSAQALQPAVLNKVLSRDDFFNYSFTLGDSPYGPVYLASIKRKLDNRTRDGIFILSVDPWSISSKSKNPEDSTRFTEVKRFLGKTNFVNLNPNVFYLLKSYYNPFYKLLNQRKTSVFLHDDGWLEVRFRYDSAYVMKRILAKVDNYREVNLPIYHESKLRLKYLANTIKYLEQFGRVYLVRLPVHSLFFEMDHELMPDFDEKLKDVIDSTGVPFLDLSYLNDSIRYTDGNHIYKDDGAMLSKMIGQWIIKQN